MTEPICPSWCRDAQPHDIHTRSIGVVLNPVLGVSAVSVSVQAAELRVPPRIGVYNVGTGWHTWVEPQHAAVVVDALEMIGAGELAELVHSAAEVAAERPEQAGRSGEGPHRPTVARLVRGEWGVCCIACSDQAGTHVPRCLVDAEGWPPLTLAEAPRNELLEGVAACQAAAAAKEGGTDA